MTKKSPGNMIAEITTGGNSPKIIDRHHRGNNGSDSNTDFDIFIEEVHYFEKCGTEYYHGSTC